MDIRKSIAHFVSNKKEYPLLAGFTAGLYVFLFHYSHNFDLSNSWRKLLFFIGYYLFLPSIVCFIIYIAIHKRRFSRFARQAIFVSMLSFFSYFLLQNIPFSLSANKLSAIAIVLIGLLSFKFSNYKAAIVFIGFMSLFPLYDLGKIIFQNSSNSTEWNRQPDSILSCRFTKKPNVYYLQVDGYAADVALKSRLYNFDNSEFDNWLKSAGFTLYGQYRSNYNSTLKSNASCFTMLHHYSRENSLSHTAGDYILGKNAVLDIFKRNGYQTSFISERPYLMMSRPDIFYDKTNFSHSEVPFLKDGWSVFKTVTAELKSQVLSAPTPHFFLVQKFDPGHIAVSGGDGVEKERQKYLSKLQIANAWLTDVVSFIEKNDPDSIIIIGADHSGFVGFNNTAEVYRKITDPVLLNTIFAARLAIRWNGDATEYDARLKSSVNLFRILFSYLSADPEYLKNLQSDTSYHNYDETDLRKVYKAIE